MRYILTLLTLCSCSKMTRYIDPELQPWLDAIQVECRSISVSKTHVVKLEQRDGKGFNGYCLKTEYYNGVYGEIIINQSDWLRFSDTKKKLLLLHELLHCERGLLDERHDRLDVMYYQDVTEEEAVTAWDNRTKYCGG